MNKLSERLRHPKKGNEDEEELQQVGIAAHAKINVIMGELLSYVTGVSG